MADFNRVTERRRPITGELWLVSAEWRGGHDRRVIRLDNIYSDANEAARYWEELTPENHARELGRPDGFDSGFVRHPLRKFVEAATSGEEG